jgi:hypothetical protein
MYGKYFPLISHQPNRPRQEDRSTCSSFVFASNGTESVVAPFSLTAFGDIFKTKANLPIHGDDWKSRSIYPLVAGDLVGVKSEESTYHTFFGEAKRRNMFLFECSK